MGIIDYLKYGNNVNRSMVKEGWTFYDTYSTQYRAEVKAKQLDRMGKHVLVTESDTGWRVWYKD